MWGQLSTTCSNVLKQPNGELPVAVNHNQLRTMPSETVDPIDWSHLPRTLMGSTPWAPRTLYISVQPPRESNVQPQYARQPTLPMRALRVILKNYTNMVVMARVEISWTLALTTEYMYTYSITGQTSHTCVMYACVLCACLLVQDHVSQLHTMRSGKS